MPAGSPWWAPSYTKIRHPTPHVKRWSVLASTHIYALDQVSTGALAPSHEILVWLHACRQTSGVGQFNRSFISPLGGLYVTLVCQWWGPLVHPLAGVAVMMALCQELQPLVTVPLALKWPNDLYANTPQGGKLAGVLVQGTQAPCGTTYAVISFGLNINPPQSHPHNTNSGARTPITQALPTHATCLYTLTGRAWDISTLFAHLCSPILRHLHGLYRDETALAAAAGPLFSLWQQPVCAQMASGHVYGCFQGLTARGQAIINGTAYGVSGLVGDFSVPHSQKPGH